MNYKDDVFFDSAFKDKNAYSYYEEVKLLDPVSKDEFTKLFSQYKKGDMEAYDKLIISNLKLVLFAVKKIKWFNIDYDELIQVGIIGLIKAIRNFDISRYCEFSTFAMKCINSEIYMFVRKENKNIKRGLLSDILLDEIMIDDYSLEENYFEKELKENLNNMILNLPDRERQIIYMYFGFIDDKIYTQKEIAKYFGVDQSYISRIIKMVLLQLQNNLVLSGLSEKKIKKNIK